MHVRELDKRLPLGNCNGQNGQILVTLVSANSSRREISNEVSRPTEMEEKRNRREKDGAKNHNHV